MRDSEPTKHCYFSIKRRAYPRSKNYQFDSPNHFEHNAPFFTETEKQLEEADLQQILHFNQSNPDLDAKEEKNRVHSDFQQVPAIKRTNGDLKPVQVEYQKEKRLLLGSGNINY